MRRIGRWVRKHFLAITLVVLAFGLIASFVVVGLMNCFDCGDGRPRITRMKLRSVENALRQYSIDNGYPTQSEGLAVLTHPPGGEKPYLKDFPKDGWNRPFAYFNPTPKGAHPFEVVSSGPDGEFGTDDDMYSHKRRF